MSNAKKYVSNLMTTNTQRVQLPDGRLLTIEGGDAANTAHLISSRYLGSAQPVANSDVSSGFGSRLVTSTPNEEPVLLMRTLDFSRAGKAEDLPEPTRPTVNAGEQVPLVMPLINFQPPGRRTQAAPKPAAVSNSSDQEPLMPTPALTFSRR
jgi:hypothetical protein